METLLIIIHVVVCLFLIGIVLLQHGKGADIGATFGGSSQSLFGTEGPVPLLNKVTTLSAVVFMVTSVALAYIASQSGSGSVMTEVSQEKAVQEETKVVEPTLVVPADQEATQTTGQNETQEQQ
jgi:preprotein translocase subunit SecG